jgi:murein DD-endopeptidase MepM/ murein hydrolase activator NlpD
MAVAGLLLYTGQVPVLMPNTMTVPSMEKSRVQTDFSEVSRSEEAQPISNQNDVATIGAKQTSSSDATPPVTAVKQAVPAPAASVPVRKAPSTAPAAQKPAQAKPNQTTAERVTAALADLPSFKADAGLQPVLGKVVRATGWYRHPDFGDWRMSPGIAIQQDVPGEVVKASYTGVVEQVQKSSGNTWTVVMLHADGWQTEYGDLGQVNVQPGTIVKQGEKLGLASTDLSQPVSFNMRHDESPVEPSKYIADLGK